MNKEMNNEKNKTKKYQRIYVFKEIDDDERGFVSGYNLYTDEETHKMLEEKMKECNDRCREKKIEIRLHFKSFEYNSLVSDALEHACHAMFDRSDPTYILEMLDDVLDGSYDVDEDEEEDEEDEEEEEESARIFF